MTDTACREPRAHTGEQGFTLVELMVSLVIFSFAIAGVLAVAVSMTRAYREQRLVIASGAGSLFNNGTAMINASGRYGERLTSDALSTTGTSVDPMSSTQRVRRALWLRTQ